MVRKSVLVADRDQLFLDLLTLQLANDGLNTIPARTCSAARLLIDNSRPQLVILDASLPDSIGLIKHIRETDEPTAVIALSDSNEVRELVRSAGIEIVLDRSIHIDGLRAAVRQCIDDEDLRVSTDDLEILVADDEEDIREVLSFALTEWGYSVLTARDGEEAVQMIEDHSAIGLVLLDISMPKIGGMEVLAKTHARLPPLSFIMLSALSDREIARRARKLGAFDYLVKPVEFERLKGLIVAGLSHRDYITRPLWRRWIS
jgi:DNA-binding NtrC family response regulator